WGDLAKQARPGKNLRPSQTLARHSWPPRAASFLRRSCRAESQAWRIYHHLRLHSPGNRLFRSVEGMVLVDGNRLVNLMMDNEVGVASRPLKLPKLDSNYFNEE